MNSKLTKNERIILKKYLAEQQGWKCIWCQQAMQETYGFRNSATIEHMIPLSCGGTDNIDNLASACRRCNSQRQSTDIDTFVEIAKDFLPDNSAYETHFTGGWIYCPKNKRKQVLELFMYLLMLVLIFNPTKIPEKSKKQKKLDVLSKLIPIDTWMKDYESKKENNNEMPIMRR